MANGTDEGVVNYAVYEDGKIKLGIAEVELPDVVLKTFTVNGPGILGDVEMPVTASPNAMITKINFRHASAEAYSLAEERTHNLTLYRADQSYDSKSGEIDVTSRKIIMRVFPKKLTGGTLKPASPLAISGEYTVLYYAEEIDGAIMREIDQLNGNYIDGTGTDRAAKIRAALGMA
ncbi:MAG: phage tail protein [Ruminococcaceae bacterium]|nr:phage tail protein [Oscillospiraceae bacterium]